MMPTKNPSVKIIPVEVNTEFTPEDGWKLNSINDTVVDGKPQFFAVLVKPAPPQAPVNLQAERDKEAKKASNALKPTPQA